MLFRFEDVFAHVEAFRVLSNLNYKVSKNEDVPSMECPFDGGRIIIGKHNLRCENATCKFLTGNFVDFLVKDKNYSYKAILEYLINQYSDNLNGVSAYDPRYVISVMSENMEKEQKFRNLIFDLREHYFNNFNSIRSASSYLRSLGFDINSCINSVFPASKSDLTEILDFLALGEDYAEFIKANSSFLLMPYFNDFTNIGSIDVIGVPSAKTKTININPANVSYFGLLHSTKHDIKYRIYNTNDEAAKYNRYYQIHSNNSIACVSPRYSDSLIQPYKLNEATVVYKPNDNIGNISKLNKYIKNIYVTSHELMSPSPSVVKWEDFLLKYIQDCIKKGNGKLTPEILDILDTIHIPANVLASLLRWVENSGFKSLSNLFKSETITNKLITLPNANIISTSYGYQYQHKNGELLPFTNFTVDLEECIAFHDDKSLYYRGKLSTSGKSLPLIISRGCFSKPSQIETEVQKAFKDTYYNTTDPLPVITNSLYSKYLTHVMTVAASSVPTVFGTSVLGWNEKSESFKTPLWEYNLHGINEISTFFNPAVTTFEHYSNKQFSRLKVTPYHNEEVDNVLSIIVGLIARSFAGLKTDPYIFVNTVNSRNLLKSIFRALGQTKINVINPNMRLSTSEFYIEGVNNYPILVSCMNKNKIKFLINPAIGLSSSGAHINTTLEDDQYKGVTVYSDTVIRKTIPYMLELCPRELEEILDKRKFSEVENDGVHLIRQAIKDPGWGSEKKTFPVFKSLIEMIGYEECLELIKLDLENQVVVITLEKKYPSYSDLVYNELSEQNIYTRNRKDSTGSFETDITTVSDILNDYFNTEFPYRLYEKEITKPIVKKREVRTKAVKSN